MSSKIYLLIVEVIFSIFHLSILILIICKRKTVFNSAFFTILRYLIAADLFLFIVMLLVQKVSLFPEIVKFYKSKNYIAYILFQCVGYFTVFQFLAHFFIAFNRFTLIWLPIKYQLIWNRQWYIFMLIILPFFHVLWKINVPAEFIFLEDNDISIVLTDKNIGNFYFILSFIIYISITFIVAILNILTFSKFYFGKNLSVFLSVVERNLLIVSFVIFFAQLLRISYTIVAVFFSPTSNVLIFFNTILPLLNGIFSWSSSLSLIFLSPSIRKEYFKFYFCKSKKQPITTNHQQIFQISVI